MTVTYTEIREQALKLSSEQRESLAQDLVASLDGEGDAWFDEATRRRRQVEAGEVAMIPRAQFMKDVREELGY